MKNAIVILMVFLIGYIITACLKDPIKICLEPVELNISKQDNWLPFDQNTIHLSGKGLRFFNPTYDDSILVDGMKIPDANLVYHYPQSDTIRIVIPGRAEKGLRVGVVELKLNLEEEDSAYHCAPPPVIKQFCYNTEEEIAIDEQQGQYDDIITLTGEFEVDNSNTSYKVYFFEDSARREAEIIGIEGEGKEKRMKVKVPRRTLKGGDNLAHHIQIELWSQDKRVCTIEGPKFTYEYTYIGTVIGGERDQKTCFGSDCIEGGKVRFCYPRGIDVDKMGNVYLADFDNQAIWTIPILEATSNSFSFQTPEPFAGACDQMEKECCVKPLMDHSGNTPTSASFIAPNYLVVNRFQSSEPIYVSEAEPVQGRSHLLVRVIENRMVHSYAGICACRENYDFNFMAHSDPPWHKDSVSFVNPQGMAVDAEGNIYIADRSLHSIFKINYESKLVDRVAAILLPVGVYLGGTAASPMLYVVSQENNSIFRINLANNNIVEPFADGFTNPTDITADDEGNLYVVDNSGSTELTRVNASGDCTPIEVMEYDADSIQRVVDFVNPQGIVYDTSKDWLFVVDTDSHLVWKIDIL